MEAGEAHLRIAGSSFLPFDCDKAYRSLQNPAMVMRCLPDFDSLEQSGEDEYIVTMRLAFATLTGLFSGTIRILEAQPPASFRIVVEGDVMLSAVKGDGLIRLRTEGQGTELTYDGDVQVSGVIAGLGQRVIDSTARAMIGKFFGRFVQEVREDPSRVNLQ